MTDVNDRYKIVHKDKTEHFKTHEGAVKFVLDLPPNSGTIEVTKYGSWNKVLIYLEGDINEIQRLAKIILNWKAT
jgi:hypothetical protein